jgi:hypothetical protein
MMSNVVLRVYSEDGGDTFLRNVCNDLQVFTARIPLSASSRRDNRIFEHGCLLGCYDVGM